jgi:UDP-N-acetylglucosamine--N-acetylmuramyl-(pentapeptide) pyrophosphoryl-undecaprenol N-acetylglucosamine transferase
MSKYKFLIAGGGTSGHINPALAIADEIKNSWPESEIIFCGTKSGLESEMIPRAGFRFQPIEARGLPTRINKNTIPAVKAFFTGRRQCRKLIRDFRPDAVIGTGGYVCSPLISAAAQLGIPSLLHEQNAFPGRSNRLMARACQMVCISFAGTEKYFGTKAPVVLTGNPVRSEFFSLTRAQAREKLKVSGNEKLVLVMGGSLGARTLNNAVLGLNSIPEWSDYIKTTSEFRLVLAAGRQHFEKVTDDISRDKPFFNLEIKEYIYDAPLWMAAADLIIARSGAMTCAELAALGRASILIPYPYAAGDHQTFNAKSLSDCGAAVMQPDKDCTPSWLASELIRLLSDSDRLAGMGEAARKIAMPDAAEKIISGLGKIMK